MPPRATGAATLSGSLLAARVWFAVEVLRFPADASCALLRRLPCPLLIPTEGAGLAPRARTPAVTLALDMGVLVAALERGDAVQA
mmetsp:Transcript_12461/g.23834  ORF Transcript_12461/g.23834 Transcript_12461/m.23834 type:complete len:85 (-) Transcript_12461:155-409(-)